MRNTLFIVILLCMLNACSQSDIKPVATVDVLRLYQDITLGKSQLHVRTGEPYQFDGSEKACINSLCDADNKNCKPAATTINSPLMHSSDFEKYYLLTKDTEGFSHYGESSAYAADIENLRQQLNALMESFTRTGLLGELKRQGKTPALMFDIDNTLEFSAAVDSDLTGKGPAIKGMVDFAKHWCFKDGIECYFVTARSCENKSTVPTQQWVQDNLQINAETTKTHTYFSRNTKQLVCENLAKPAPNVAYKDIIRNAMEQQKNVFWLMSIGDQLTDSLGEHSGIKVRVPNQFFNADINPNQFAPYGVGQCGTLNTISPPPSCTEQLVGKALGVTNLEYCSQQ